MPTTMKLIAKTTLGSDAANIEFTNIPGTYTDLVLISSLRSNRAELDDQVLLTVNGNTASISVRWLYGQGSTVSSGTTPSTYTGSVSAATSTASTFGSHEIYFPNYAGSTNKSFSATGASESNGSFAVLTSVAGLWSNTAAITSLRIAPGFGTTWLTGSSSFLYGITKADDRTPGTFGIQATGGEVSISGGYKYHVFKSSGTFTVTEPGWAEVLVVGGGGGGGSASISNQPASGGGGAGGVLLASSFVRNGPVNVLVGAGGAAAVNGQDSTFLNVNALGGGSGKVSGAGNPGGSGGGGANGGIGGLGTAGQGNNGGSAAGSFQQGGGGGGYATAGSLPNGGNGSNTLSGWTAISNTAVSGYIAGGGGGGGYDSTARGTGGLGGGGNGGNASNTATAGTTNTGSGGGGGAGGNPASTQWVGGNGGSGIIIIRYPVS